MNVGRRVFLTMVAAAVLASGCAGGSAVPPSTIPTVASVSINPTRIVGGDLTAQGTVTLSAPPTRGVTVLLASDSTFAFVPSALTIPAGVTTGSFPIATVPVLTAAIARISAVANDTARSAALTLTSGLAANFSVASLSPAQAPGTPTSTPVPGRGAGAADTCPLVVNGGTPTLDCQFNGSASTALGFPIARYSWTYAFGGQERTEVSSGPIFKPTASGCGFFASQAGPDGPYIEMSVSLRVESRGGGTSDLQTNRNVRIYPNGLCGYGF